MHYNFEKLHQTSKEFEIPLTIHHSVVLTLVSMDPVQIIGKNKKEEVLLRIITDQTKFSATYENFDTLIIRGKSQIQKIGFYYTDKPLYHEPTMHIHEPLPEPTVDHEMLSDIKLIREHLERTGPPQPAVIRSTYEPGGFPSLYEISDDLEDIFEEEEEMLLATHNANPPQPQPEPEAQPIPEEPKSE
ncbi:MAG: internal scaffolding protein [Microviridae sp.]|nr:MAG: internal scaffolding protein [Microviridae sp.]